MSEVAEARAETRAAIRGRSDEEILRWIESLGGSDVFLESAFSGLCEAFLAERAAGRAAVVEWDIDTPDQGLVRYGVMIGDGACSVRRGAPDDSQLTLTIDVVNFVRLLVGILDSNKAADAGTLVVKGDVELARTIGDWFEPAHS